MTFSVNQVRQLYVVTTNGGLKTPNVATTDKAGSIAVKSDNAKTHMYFQYMGAAGMMRSDLINPKNILDFNVASYKDMQKELKSYTVTLDKTVNEGNPLGGQDYILRIAFRQYIGMSDEDLYFKYGLVHAYAGMTPSEFYKVLALSLAHNFKRELVPLLDISLIDHTTSAGPATETDVNVPVLKNGKVQNFTLETGHEYTGVIINEVPQEWTLGIKAQVPVYFQVIPTTITVGGDERIWGNVKEITPVGVVDNGKEIADLEYFCMGFRGDMYRNINWPNSIPTKYLVDPELKYNVINIHYAYTGANEHVQKSEKDLTIVIPSTISAKTFITAIQTASGVTATFTAEAAKDSNLK